MTWELKPGAAPDNAHYQGNTNVNGEDMTEIEENMLLPISGQELPIRWLAQHGSEKPVTHVSRDGLQALHIARAEELPAVTALAVSHKTSLLDPLEIRELHKLVRDTDKVFPNPGNSNLGLITAFFEAYLNADYTDRGLLTKEWMKGNRVSHITCTASGANAGGGNRMMKKNRNHLEQRQLNRERLKQWNRTQLNIIRTRSRWMLSHR